MPVFIKYEKTLEQEMREDYNIPHHVKVEDFPKYIGKHMAESISKTLLEKRESK